MIIFKERRKGFTLIEILISSLMLAIVVASAYGIFIATVRMTSFSRNELEAYRNASAWLDRVRAELSQDEVTLGQNNIDLNDAANSIAQEDHAANWPLATDSINVDNLQATYRTDFTAATGGVPEDLDLGAGTLQDGTTPFTFRRVDATISWQGAGD
ncbi:type II secretion system protein J [Candidatus Omnitrophota bacterium]